MTLMRHFLMAHTNQQARSHHTTSSTPWFWQVIGITAFLCLGLVSEGLASHTVSPKSLTFYAVQGATNPPTQTITSSKATSSTETLTASDNATWLTVSPTTTSVITSKKLTVAVNTSGRTAGTYKATITIKVNTWYTWSIPVTLIISPATSSPPSSPSPTTSTATLTWNATTGTVSGYKIYVGEAPRLYTRTITVSNVTSSTVNSLTVGRMYYFAVTAYNSAGESGPSNEVSKTIQ
ncbi:MAG: fibronectin type III domain-containing protein [Nitrospira sp.]|nr:fibronectin type III domain-containing protein [Nitrospira sp.]